VFAKHPYVKDSTKTYLLLARCTVVWVKLKGEYKYHAMGSYRILEVELHISLAFKLYDSGQIHSTAPLYLGIIFVDTIEEENPLPLPGNKPLLPARSAQVLYNQTFIGR
jgi:hypothetical protein